MVQNSEASRERGLPHTAETSKEPWRNQKKSPHHVRNVCSHWLTFHPGPSGLDEEGRGCRHFFPTTQLSSPRPLTTGPDACPTEPSWATPSLSLCSTRHPPQRLYPPNPATFLSVCHALRSRLGGG